MVIASCHGMISKCAKWTLVHKSLIFSSPPPPSNHPIHGKKQRFPPFFSRIYPDQKKTLLKLLPTLHLPPKKSDFFPPFKFVSLFLSLREYGNRSPYVQYDSQTHRNFFLPLSPLWEFKLVNGFLLYVLVFPPLVCLSLSLWAFVEEEEEKCSCLFWHCTQQRLWQRERETKRERGEEEEEDKRKRTCFLDFRVILAQVTRTRQSCRALRCYHRRWMPGDVVVVLVHFWNAFSGQHCCWCCECKL